MIGEVATGIVEELREKYGLEPTMTPGMTFILHDPQEQHDKPEVNSWSIKANGFTISVMAGRITLHPSTTADRRYAGPITNLPGVVLDAMVGKSESIAFDLKDPKSIDNVYRKLEELKLVG